MLVRGACVESCQFSFLWLVVRSLRFVCPALREPRNAVYTPRTTSTTPTSSRRARNTSGELANADSPGGVSTTNQSNSPQTTSPKNCRTIASFFGPRQTTDSREERRRKPMEMQASRPGEERVRAEEAAAGEEEDDGWAAEEPEGCGRGTAEGGEVSARRYCGGNEASRANLVGRWERAR